MSLDANSIHFLAGVHPDLRRVVELASETASFRLTEGLRAIERQRDLVAAGKSQTLNSRHLTGHAVDFIALVDGKGTYAEEAMRAVWREMKLAGEVMGVPLEWGGDWKTFQDTPHVQLPWREYPAGGGRVLPNEPEPQAAAAAPEPAAAPSGGGAAAPVAPVKAAWQGSWTIWGALLSVFGSIVQYLSESVRFLLEVAAEASSLAPLQGLASQIGVNLPSIGFGLGVTGGLIAIGRRLDAAKKGREG